jgi:hypothetical protein
MTVNTRKNFLFSQTFFFSLTSALLFFAPSQSVSYYERRHDDRFRAFTQSPSKLIEKILLPRFVFIFFFTLFLFHFMNSFCPQLHNELLFFSVEISQTFSAFPLSLFLINLRTKIQSQLYSFFYVNVS